MTTSRTTPLKLAQIVVVAAAVIALQACSGGRLPANEPAPRPRLRLLIIDGMNNHDWPRATATLKQILLQSGRFQVDVTTSPDAKAPDEAWQRWRPPFDDHDVVLSNFNGGHRPTDRHWPEPLKRAFQRYVADGGGLVVYHSANNSFPNWPEYNRMIGLGWRDRQFGPGLIVDANERVIRVPKGQGRNPGHGPEHNFRVSVLAADHPITRGIPKHWMHAHDQLSHGQRGPAQQLTVLSYAYSKDTTDNEVVDWVTRYGQGRVYTTMLGHLWKGKPDTAMRCVGFQTMLIRGCQWAATGKVDYPVPDDFPKADATSLRDGPRQSR